MKVSYFVEYVQYNISFYCFTGSPADTNTIVKYLQNYIVKHRKSTAISGIQVIDYELKNREESFKELGAAFNQLNVAMDKSSVVAQPSNGKDIVCSKSVSRNEFKIPMLAGPAGIGKTSMINHISDQLQTKTVMQCHVQYYYGFIVLPLEIEHFDAVASVAHRMLYLTFLHKNSHNLDLGSYMLHMLNAGMNNLTLNVAIRVMRCMYQINHPDIVFRSRHSPADQSNVHQQPFQLLLAIDECQELNKFQRSADNSISEDQGLDQVCQALIGVMKEGEDQVYPVLAGTDYEAAMRWSAKGAIEYITLPPVPPVEVLQSVRAVKPFELTRLVAVLAFRLSVPRPVAEFAELLSAAETHVSSTTIAAESMQGTMKKENSENFSSEDESSAIEENEDTSMLTAEELKKIWSKIAQDPRFAVQVLTGDLSEHTISTTGGASIRTLLAVVATSLTGRSVNPNDKCHHFTTCGAGTEGWVMEPVETVPTWRLVRRSGLCTFENDPNNIGNVYIRTSYAVIAKVGCALNDIKRVNGVLFALSNCIGQLNSLVEDHVVVLEQWQAWERFGALYEALRINCWLLLKETTIVLSELYLGCIVRKCDYEVRLRPTLVVQATDTISGDQVQVDRNLHWYKEKDFNYLVVTKSGTAGIDYLYALELMEQPGKYVAVLNQRKSDHVCAGPRTVKNLRKLAYDAFADMVTTDNSDVVLSVVGLCSQNVDSIPSIPDDTYFCGRIHSAAYHGSLLFHPAATPEVHLNYANKTSILHNITGPSKKKKDEAVTLILSLRRRSNHICSLQEFQDELMKNNITSSFGHDSHADIQFGSWVR